MLQTPRKALVLPSAAARVVRRCLGLRRAPILPPKRLRGRAVWIYPLVLDALGSVRPFGRSDPALRCDRYLIYCIALWLGEVALSRATVASYLLALRPWIASADLRRLDRHLALRPQSLDLEVQRLAEAYSPRTVVARMTAIRSWLAWLCRRELRIRTCFDPRRHLVAVDRARLYHPRRRAGVRQSLTKPQAEALASYALTTARPMVGLALTLLAFAGLRRSEVLGLRWSNLWQDGTAWMLTVRGKGQRSRPVHVDRIVWTAMQRVIATRRGRRVAVDTAMVPVSRTTLATWVAGFGATIGRPDLTPHELRRSYATLIRDAGSPIEDVQRLLGHSSPALTLAYYDLGGIRRAPSTGITLPIAATA